MEAEYGGDATWNQIAEQNSSDQELWDQKAPDKSSFGNGRAVRTLWERTREAQAMRLATKGVGSAGRDAIMRIDVSDIEAAETDRTKAAGAGR